MTIHLWVKKLTYLVSVFLVFSYQSVVLANTTINTPAIAKAINGTDATLYDPQLIPWQAALKQKDFDSVSCGAVVISEYWLLTAAHCNSSDIGDIAIVGTSMIQDGNFNNIDEKHFYKIVTKITHPHYNEENFINDIALFRVNRSMYAVAQPIKLVTPNEQIMADITFSNSWATNVDSPVTAIASGWGDALTEGYPTTLQVISLAGVPDSQCVGLNIGYEHIVCADSNVNGLIKDVCSGDSGGPLIWQNQQAVSDSDKGIRLIGLTSNGAKCSSRTDNPENQYNQLTGQYTQVSTHRDWIELQVQSYDNSNFSLNDSSLQPTLNIDPFAVIKDDSNNRDNTKIVVTATAEQAGSGGAITLSNLMLIILILYSRRNQRN
ncbi:MULTISPECIES: serine protease [unclassified Photobacterium]|uniref:S1 family serine peptidase n=1 Tax=unclassified Photobacterium TaxID=2628852 RepID=UPI001EDDEFF7|nr:MULTISPECIES: serine protease [unclassified Photobacterium]MCG3864590.1 serine protease [Photobacterium sp. Ph6]MCG3876002.1 serine protease [Photobacterium sp. Ph5]